MQNFHLQMVDMLRKACDLRVGVVFLFGTRNSAKRTSFHHPFCGGECAGAPRGRVEAVEFVTANGELKVESNLVEKYWFKQFFGRLAAENVGGDT